LKFDIVKGDFPLAHFIIEIIYFCRIAKMIK